MVRVKTIKDHSNNLGDSYFKSGSAGPIYDVPEEEVQTLVNGGYVEIVDEGGNRGSAGDTSESARPTSEHRQSDTEKVSAKGSKTRSRSR